jgi:hypothetical protein
MLCLTQFSRLCMLVRPLAEGKAGEKSVDRMSAEGCVASVPDFYDFVVHISNGYGRRCSKTRKG